MKASKLLKIIRKELKDYPIEYLRNKVTDDRYRDPLVKKLAKYNSEAYDEIYSLEIKDDFDVNDSVINKMKGDINYYFDTDRSNLSDRTDTVLMQVFDMLWQKKVVPASLTNGMAADQFTGL